QGVRELKNVFRGPVPVHPAPERSAVIRVDAVGPVFSVDDTGCHLGTFIVAGGSRPDFRIKIKSYQQRSGPTLIKAAGPSVLGEVRNGFPELGFYKGKYLLGTGLSGDGFRIGDNGDGTEKVDQKKVKPGAKRSHFRNVLRLFTFFHPQLGIIQFLKVFQDHVALANALVRTNPASVNMAVL